VFDSLKKEIQSTPAVRDRVRFVTLSFDPARDSPEVMKDYAGSRIKESRGLRWYFLTTRSVRDLLPLVEGFGQDIRYSVDKSTGRPVRELSHVLKVFLIDRSGAIREIYTSNLFTFASGDERHQDAVDGTGRKVSLTRDGFGAHRTAAAMQHRWPGFTRCACAGIRASAVRSKLRALGVVRPALVAS